MRRKGFLILLALSVCLILAACGSGHEVPEVAITVKDIREEVLAAAAANVREGTPFSEIPCEDYDDTKLMQMIAEAEQKTVDAANADQVLQLFGQILEEQEQLRLCCEMADIYAYIDGNNDSCSQLSLKLSNASYTYGNQIFYLGKQIINSPCGAAAEKVWDEYTVYYYKYAEIPEALLALQAEEEELEDRYEEYSAQEFTVEVNGKEYNESELSSDQTLSDKQYSAACRELARKKNEVLGPVYVELVKVRQQIAEYSGCDNYTDYAYANIYGRDYTPHDAQKLEEYVKEYLTEPVDELYNHYDADLGAALDQAFAGMSIPDQMKLAKAWLPDVDSSCLSAFLYMEENGLCSTEYSENKRGGGFTTWLDVYDEPFLYNQPEGDFYDFISLIHEFGHFNAFYTDSDAAYNSCVELSELHSQGLEALYTIFYPEILGEEYGKNATEYTLIDLSRAVLDGCMYDEFQQQVYKLKDPTLDEINRIFCTVAEEYGYDYSGEEEAYDWVEVPHNFTQPFYYISYAASALPSLYIWNLSREDAHAAIQLYLAIVADSTSGTFKETLTEYGMQNPFRAECIRNIADALTAYEK